MNSTKWRNWRLDALNEITEKDVNSYQTALQYVKQKDPNGKLALPNEQIATKQVMNSHHGDWYAWLENQFNAAYEPAGPNETQIAEAYHYLSSEEKIGLALREMRKHLSLIERQFIKANESSKINEAQVENWVKTYKSLQAIEQKVKGLLKTMKGEM